MKNLQMSLKTKWFKMTKAGIKTEDYREINEYWVRRLFYFDNEITNDILSEFVCDLSNFEIEHRSVVDCMLFFGAKFKKFNFNIMTLGYPKSTDSERILMLIHKGIEIRAGNQEWGAEQGKLYFVIKHGEILH